MKTELIAIALLLALILTLVGAELITLTKLNHLEKRLMDGADANELYECFRKADDFFIFIFSREQIRELELAFFEYSLSGGEEEKSRLAEEISHVRRQLLLCFN